MSNNAVIYARYSSHAQREESIEDQIKACEKYAEEVGLTVIKSYADYAMTGKTDDRPEFKLMLDAAKTKNFQAILVYKNDRFARNRFDAILHKKKLKDLGVSVVAIKEPIPEGAGGIVMESLYESMAEMYSVNLSENVRRGHASNAQKCMANGRAPLGYKVDPVTRRFIKDEMTAPLITKMFELTANGSSYEEVTNYLATQGIKKSKACIYSALRNRRYLGLYIYDNVEIPDGMPALVSQDIFDRANKRIQNRKRHPRSKPSYYPLSLKIFCGSCGKLMTGEYGRGRNGTEYRYYSCSGSKRFKTCTAKSISADKIEQLVLTCIKKDILAPISIDKIATSVIDYQEKELTADSVSASLIHQLKEYSPHERG